MVTFQLSALAQVVMPGRKGAHGRKVLGQVAREIRLIADGIDFALDREPKDRRPPARGSRGVRLLQALR